jgi:hypothetical protein
MRSPYSPSKYSLIYRDQGMEITTNSIAACAANTPARGRFGTQNIDLMKYLNFKPNRQLAGIEPAQCAIEFEVTGIESQQGAVHA